MKVYTLTEKGPCGNYLVVLKPQTNPIKIKGKSVRGF